MEINKEALPMTHILVNGKKCIALIDTGYTQMLVSRFMCHSWKPKEVLRADGKTQKKVKLSPIGYRRH